jgi:hypothetical protein
VWADAEFDTERNHTLVRKELRAQSVIEPSVVFAPRCEERFPCASTECAHMCKLLLSSVMRKLSARALGRTMEMHQAERLGLAYNTYRV